ncbi:MAG: LptE family protein [Kiritimatiellaeota bacterium]|nr:LptE family protein [Kiritimatiellota bacterium]
MPKPSHSLLALAAFGLALLPGCVGYRLGSMLPPEIKTVHVPTFINQTSEPQLELDTTRFALQEFQKDGSLKLAPAEEADAILAVKLTDYKLAPLQYDANRPTAALEYRITLYASIVMTRKRDGKVIAENPRCFGEGTFPVVGDLSSSKRTGLPKAAKDLAHDIVQKVTEVW